MKDHTCISCRRPKGILTCGVCQESVCKNCAQFLEESTFSFLAEIPEDLMHTYYCTSCYDSHVAPALHSYNEIMERARGMFFFFETQRKPIPVMTRATTTVQVKECDDRDETVLRLAFKAAELGFNSIIEAKVVAQKIRNSGYQKSLWVGAGLPANLNIERLMRAYERRE